MVVRRRKKGGCHKFFRSQHRFFYGSRNDRFVANIERGIIVGGEMMHAMVCFGFNREG
jgi:hypothetical protein